MSTPSSQTIKASAYFSLRIVNIDHYMAPPGPMDRSFCPFNQQGAPLPEVPVIRIFGTTEGGQRTCLHVHQVSEWNAFGERAEARAEDAKLFWEIWGTQFLQKLIEIYLIVSTP